MSEDNKNSLRSLTIWSPNQVELIPTRFRYIIAWVMPMIYLLMILFGITSLLFPLQDFVTAIGLNYTYVWTSLVGVFSIISLFGLIFKLRLELYSSLILTILLLVLPIYLLYTIFFDPVNGGVDQLNDFFGAILYPIMPGWRVFDILIDIRKSVKRQLYAETTQGEP